MSSLKVIQFVFRSEDGAENDVWREVCPELIPAEKEAAGFSRIIAALERVGIRTKTHIYCWPQEDLMLTKEEFADLNTLMYELMYEEYGPPADTPRDYYWTVHYHCIKNKKQKTKTKNKKQKTKNKNKRRKPPFVFGFI